MNPPIFVALALAYALFASFLFVRKDKEEYGRFKLLVATDQRQAYYRRWVVRSFAVFGLSSIAILTLFGRLDSVFRFPEELVSVRASLLYKSLAPPSGSVSPQFLIGFFVSAMFGTMLVMLILGLKGAKQPMLGDIEAVIPRNWGERRWATLLSINAGVSEEMFFRLLIPLLVTLLVGDAVVGFAFAIMLFGLFHAYQGWVGVLATTVVGIALTVLYIVSANLAIVILAHAAMDLLNLVLRPWLTDRYRAAERVPRSL